MQETTDLTQPPAEHDEKRPTAPDEVVYDQVVVPISRRKSLVTGPIHAIRLPGYEAHSVSSSTLPQTLLRTTLWIRAMLAFFLGSLRDRISPWHSDTVERRAERLYQIIKNLGGSFLKLGQQLGIRID